ncbi:MAG: alcohol dehydrogenase catalytic domain-containing protein [Deltaproteobacteria bacterium]|nr:alcohol dehydrogenase catalytic domain-containing protein [Deltaproteobacteria bacterium]
MESMKAAVLEEYRRFSWKEVPRPLPAGREVLVKVTFAGICGSDQHIFLGEFHPRTRLPLIPGHEFCGEIVETGRDVKSFKAGDRVVVDPIIACGRCPACERGHYPACPSLRLVGIDLDGGFGEYVKVPETMLHRIDRRIPDRHAALVEQLSIGFHACRRAQVAAGDSIVIWGAGKVGQSILQAVRTKTDHTVIVVDLFEKRLGKAREAYPDIHVVNPAKGDPIGRIMDLTQGRGVDIAFEAVGHFKPTEGRPNPVQGCVQAIRGGGTVCVLGLSNEATPVLFKNLIWKEAQIVSSRVTHGEFEETIRHLVEEDLNPEALISDVVPASRAQAAFEMLEKDPENHLKILLRF